MDQDDQKNSKKMLGHQEEKQVAQLSKKAWWV
jgi:hypothetical protein